MENRVNPPLTFTHPRLRREAQTIQAMTALYCREQHNPPAGSLCADCEELQEYALQRLHRCPFQEEKSTCAKCRIHCYQPAMRERVRVMMRYAGPRMLRSHPILAVLHLLDGLRPAPEPSGRRVPKA